MRKYKKCIVYYKKYVGLRYISRKFSPCHTLILLDLKNYIIHVKDISFNITKKHLTPLFIESLLSISKNWCCVNGDHLRVVKRMKNYKRDWFKGDLEKIMRDEFRDCIFLGGI